VPSRRMEGEVAEANSWIVRARTVVTCDTDAPQAGIDFNKLGRIDDAAVIIEDGIIAAVGPAGVILGGASDSGRSRRAKISEIDLRDYVIVPGLVDAHAHTLFAGDR
jgi:imidazolonepropionase-like amidohydrolase